MSKPIRQLLIKPIRFYQKHISSSTPPSCKYIPTCSNYAIEAIEVHGAVKGSMLAACRLLRCNPFSKGGFDPVPPAKNKRKP